MTRAKMPPKRTRGKPDEAVAGKKLKILIKSSSANNSLSNTSLEDATFKSNVVDLEEEEEDLILSDDEQLTIGSSPVKKASPKKTSAGKIQLRLSISKSPESSSASSSELDIEDDDLVDGGEEEISDNLDDSESDESERMDFSQQ